MINNMGAGGVSTRSGFDSDYPEGRKHSLCRKWMRDLGIFLRDLVIFFWWVLPGHAVNTRLYLLILARLVIYAGEGVAFYSLVATVLAGTDEEVEWLVELTRIILCEASDKMGTKATRGARAKREADSWTDLVQRVNSTRPKMAEILQDLYQTSTKSSLDYITDVTTEVRGLTEPTSGTWVTGTSFPTLDNDSLYMDHHYTTTRATDPNHTSSLADIPTRSPFEGNLWLGSNATESTTALQFNTSQDIPESISYQTTQVVFEFCTRVENITDQETSIYCMTGLALPACILVAVVISSMICGYVLARMCSKRQYLGPQSTGINPLSSACPLPTTQP